MRLRNVLVSLAAVGAQGIRILQSNDDGWAELYIRSFNDALNAAGHDVVLSGPAENKSGSSSLDLEPSPRSSACQYNSCAANSGPVGSNTTNPRLNWVNSFPVTSARYGLTQFGPVIWNGQQAQLVVAGPNVGSNVYLSVPFSGTVGIAVYAAHEKGLPSIAFSGASDGTLAWNTRPEPTRSLVYAQLATQFTNALVKGGAPYLPADVWLNVNFPKAEGACANAQNYKWVLSRINQGFLSAPDVTTCGTDRLPNESDVIGTAGCYASVSVGDASDKTTASADKQAVVLARLGSMFTCLP
ncbi:survival protein sure-like phosphatase/nucleotidase [Pseudomassariella vexata]|uniref:Survival protein sure-like phosphatase/nucleotidase n=1 Tax=Pseudomassariella vexata TaxID=1141098 RepID=A0A1Y2EIF0_9PEZI|nr:survival protein sure-like phosphatase/nucleotidase [Pseudomassariella vexata]ORY71362.1 survival protein sure-like phosphatase/nucleotidase [Pseudomassariella vexata]